MQLGTYWIEGELGRGGAGRALRARAPDGSAVVVKVLLNVKSKTSLARFDRERQLLAELAGEGGFVPLLDYGLSAEGPYLVTPFLAGATLSARMEAGPWPVHKAVKLGRKLAKALGRAHDVGIVHRDLKPDNVLYDERGQPLIADLGLGKHLTGSDSDVGGITQTGTMAGTMGYMPPEQMLNAKQVGPQADVFALGVVLYQLVTGGMPFSGGSSLEVVNAMMTADYLSVQELSSRVPDAVCTVIERCLSAKPEDRYDDGAALARALMRAESSQKGKSRGPSKRRETSPAALVGAVSGVLALAIAVFMLATRERPQVAEAPPRPEPGAPEVERPPDPPPHAEPEPEPQAEPEALEPEPEPEAPEPAPASEPSSLRAAVDGLAGLVVERQVMDGDGRAVVCANADTGDLVVADATGRVMRWIGERREVIADGPAGDGPARVAIAGNHALVVRDGAGFLVDLRTGVSRRVNGFEFACVLRYDEGHFLSGMADGRALRIAPDMNAKSWTLFKGSPVELLARRGERSFGVGQHAAGKWSFTAWGPDFNRRQVLITTPTALAPAGDQVVVGDERGHLLVYDLTGSGTVRMANGHTKAAVIGLAASPDGRTVISSGGDDTVAAWALGEKGLKALERRKTGPTSDRVVSITGLEGGRVVFGSEGGLAIVCRWGS